MFLPQNEKNNPGIFGGDGCVYYLESDASNLSVYICPNSLDCFHYMSFFVHQLYLSKARAGVGEGGREEQRNYIPCVEEVAGAKVLRQHRFDSVDFIVFIAVQ